MKHLHTLLVCLLFATGCASLTRPRDAVGRAYTAHVTLVSELNNFEADEGRKLLDAAPATREGQALYGAAIDAHRKACDFAKGQLAKALKGVEEIRASMTPVKR